ncbi:hypothetical protein MSAS_43180 [Mycobacterium saskatchewanense]|nr:hypothetical protein MSAS_43180 [Mycobacterium saskatchewanense]
MKATGMSRAIAAEGTIKDSTGSAKTGVGNAATPNPVTSTTAAVVRTSSDAQT